MPEDFAKKLLKPEGFWRLLDDTVFQFNDLYRRFWRNGGDPLGRSSGKAGPKDAFVVPAMFDKQSRTFNWIALADPILDGSSDTAAVNTATIRSSKLTEIIRGLSEHFSTNATNTDCLQWSSFTRLFDDSPHCQAALLNLDTEIKKFRIDGKTYQSDLQNHIVRITKLNHSVSILYSSYSHPRNHSLEGCFFEALEKFGHNSPKRVEHPIFGRLRESKLDLEDWRAARGIERTEWKYDPWDGREQETIKLSDFPNINYTDDRIKLSKLVLTYFLTPLFMSWELDFNGKKGSFEKFLEDLGFLVLVPIYDVWIGSSGFGGLQAVFLVFLTPPCDGEESSELVGKKAWEAVYNTKVLPRCEILAQGISATAIRRAIATPITQPYDLVTHFLKILTEVQDWEEAIVYREKVPAVRFRRNADLISEGRLRVRIPWELDNKFDPAKVEGPARQSGGLVSNDNDLYMWWTCESGQASEASRPHYDLWSEYCLPELTAEERAVFQDTSIRFKFPKASRIPPQDDKSSRDYLVETYLRQQLDLMRALIPKVRARRAALRNAVSAIMGRNMSHNIGSHVLARYASQVVVEQDIVSDRLDPRADFLSYLQRRMDFLAEVSTADRAYWTQPLSLKQQLDKLNYTTQVNIFNGETPIAGRFPPLLKFITGKDKLRATVCMKDEECDAPLLFSCPGGEVGVHALYVILENVIRNSARHNGKKEETTHGAPDEEVRIDVEIEPSNRDKLIKLRIWDTRSDLRCDGSAGDETFATGPKWTYAGGAELKARRERLETDEQGNSKFSAVPDRINWIIQHEPILDSDGTPEPNYWGVREMQICAQYLRQLRLSDLETLPVAEDDTAANKTVDIDPLIVAECAEYKDGKDTKYCLTYVIYIAPAALRATVSAAGEGEATSWKVSSGFAELKLSDAAIDGTEHAPPGSALARGLEQIGNYSFVVHCGENDIEEWVKQNQECLPIRRIPSSAIEKREPDAVADPVAVMEGLHEAYAARIAQLPKDHRLAGFAIADGGLGRAEAKLGKQAQEWATPISCASGGWDDWALSFGEGTLHAAFWIDHVDEIKIDTLQNDIGGFNADTPDEYHVDSLAWEPCFFGFPSSSALNDFGRNQGWELMAACLPRVVVLDERVQAQAGTLFRSIPLSEYWRGMRVEIPPKKPCDLDRPAMGLCRNWLKTIDKPVDFVIVHLTMLERLRDECGLPDATAAITALIEDNDRLAHAEVAVVTGRGVATFGRSLSKPGWAGPGQRPRYLPVSAFLEYLVRRPSKLGLMRVLWSASKPKGKQ